LELNSFTPLYIFVSTVKKLENTTQKAQQSDYEYSWDKKLESTNNSKTKKSLLSIIWKEIKDKIKFMFRNNYLLKFFFIRHEKKRLFLKNFYKKNSNLIKLEYNIK
jgi:hypothetical protein